jgi:integrase
MSIKKIERKNGISWRVRLQDSRGVDYYKTFPKKVLAEEYENSEKLAKLQGFVKSTDSKKKNKTIRDLCDAYCDLNFPRLREGSIMSYTLYIKNHIIPSLGEKRISTIKKNNVSQFENELLLSGYSAQTIHNIIYFFSTLMNYACDELHWVERNLVKNYKAKKIEKSSIPTYWENEDIQLFFNNSHFDKNYYKNLYLFLINTGCRIGETGGLRIQDVDFKKNRLYIGWTLAKNNYKGEKNKGIYFSLNRQKGSNDRFVPMNKTVYTIMKNLCGNRAKTEFVFTNQPKEFRKIVYRDGSNKEVVITAPVINSQHFSEQRFSKLQIKIGVDPSKRIGAHGLRHTFASHYIMNGGNLYTLSKLMGHSSVKITEVYAHLSPDYLMDVEKYVEFDF